jgi:2-succinyl-6-hydroxy-2,4-cyclohexadiene-1-carboxylate synthase
VPESLVLLHGFSGTRHAWDAVAAQLSAQRYLPLALDLPGHGDAAQQDAPITFSSCVASVLTRSPERCVLCGYSLGGRVAMHVALTAPERVTRLVLVSTSAGIEDPTERAERRLADRRLADELERIPFERFIERWRTQPLFADEPPAAGELARADQRRNDPHALAAALRGLGVGDMRSLWGELEAISSPAIVLVGRRDEKYVAIGRRMAALIPDAHLAEVSGGHGLPLENPDAVAEEIERLGGPR